MLICEKPPAEGAMKTRGSSRPAIWFALAILAILVSTEASEKVLPDCSTYTSCTECVSSPLSCDWCLGRHHCTNDTNETCRSDALITGASSVIPPFRFGPTFCPRITSFYKTTEFLIPMGVARGIRVKVEMLPPFLALERMACQFTMEGTVMQVNAQLIGETIYCEAMEFKYSHRAPNVTAALSVLLGQSKPLDNPDGLHLLVYRCDSMSNSTESCLALADEFGCGLCPELNSCTLQVECQKVNGQWTNETGSSGVETRMRPPTQQPPDVTRFVAIDGVMLDRVVSAMTRDDYIDIVGGKHDKKKMYCRTDPLLYVNATRICDLETLSLIMRHRQASGEEATVPRIPRITSIIPSKGPISGGTKLKIWGIYKDEGNSTQAFLGGLSCYIKERRPNMITCITPSLSNNCTHKSVVVNVTLQIGSSVTIQKDSAFLYVPDPLIYSVTSPEVDNSSVIGRSPSGTPDGGNSVRVEGANLNSVQEPKMFLVHGGVEYYNVCVAESSTEMRCISPAVPADKLNFSDGQKFTEMEYGFTMDNVQGVRHLSTTSFPKFRMFP